MKRESLTSSSRRTFLQTAALGTLSLAWPAQCWAHSKSQTPPLPVDFLEAIARGDLAKVQQLLKADPSLLYRTDAQGRSAYALAYISGHAEVGAYLKEQGYASDLHEAALAQDWDRFTAQATEYPARVNADHPIGGTAMYAAALGGAAAQVWRIYAASGYPNVNPRQAQGATPLQVALQHRDLHVAEVTAASILGNNGDPNPALNALPPPLHLAVGRGSRELADMLVQFGADVEARDAHGRRAVEYAHRMEHTALVEWLERAQQHPRVYHATRAAFDIDGRSYQAPDTLFASVDRQGRVVGAAHNDLEGVQQYVTATPALVHAAATTGERAVEAGAHMGNHAIVDYLLERGAPYALTTAVMRNDLTQVRALLAADPQRIHERGAHGFALLWYPIIGQTGTEMMELLLAHGGNVEQQHFLGTTALHWAARRSADMVALLLEHGADPNRVGRKFGGRPQTPLQIARGADRSDIVRLLQDHGAQE